MPGQHGGGLLPHLTDAQAVDQLAEVIGFGFFNGPDQILRRLRPHAVQLGHILRMKVIEIRHIDDEAVFHQLSHHRRAEALNVHGVPAGKVGDVPLKLGGTLRAGAAEGRAVLVPDHRRAADRAHLRQGVGLRPLRALRQIHGQNLRDDLSRLLHQHRISDADVLFRDEILIVEGSTGHGGARQTHRGQYRLGRQDAGAPHLHHDVRHRGVFLLRGILIGHGPLGEFGRGAENRAVRQAVHLHHRAVNIKGIVHPLVIDPEDLRLDLRCAAEGLVGNDLEPLGGQIVKGLRVGGEFPALRQLQIEHGDVQLPLGADLGIQLPQRPGGGVPGVGHQGLALQLPLGVDALKHGPGHVDLAPNDEPGQLFRQCHGNGTDGAEVFRHVLAHPAVSPCSAPDKHAVPVFQRHGQAVHLGLHGIFRHGAEGLLHLLAEGGHFALVEHILKAFQRYLVGVGLEGIQNFAAYPLGGGIRGDLLRVLRLQFLQAAVQTVIFIVRDHRGV